MIVIIMGVSGSGKSTIGKLLAVKLGLSFIDADDLHPGNNIEKMTIGKALSDHDRQEWLKRINDLIKKNDNNRGIVVACSALKEKYRKSIIKDVQKKVYWVFLHGENELLSSRIQSRKNHFMPLSLLQSQLDILEKPDYGIHINVEKTPDEIINLIIKQIDNAKES